ncbi:MAG: biotin--[acetyl-CoA-carboxylase] ligase [Alphaproteobacteria bacterium]
MSIRWSIETYDTVQSTQDIVKGMAEMEAPEGRVIHALEQSEGRGRHGREWVSEKGNLYLSVLLRPSCHARQIGQLSILIAVALADTVRPHLKDPEKMRLKWPNDIMIDDQKCAGILIETSVSASGAILYAAVGVGLNIASGPRQIATALNLHTLKPLKVKAIRDEFLKNLGDLYSTWNREGFAEIKDRWLKIAHKRDESLRIRVGAQIEQGQFHGIDDDGNLLLHDRDLRLKKVTAGEVYLINTSL